MSRSATFGSFLDGIAGGVGTGMYLRERYDARKKRKEDEATEKRIRSAGGTKPAPTPSNTAGEAGFQGPTRAPAMPALSPARTPSTPQLMAASDEPAAPTAAPGVRRNPRALSRAPLVRGWGVRGR